LPFNLVRCFVTRHGLSFLLQPSLSHVFDFPFLRCHRCSVTDNQILSQRLYYRVTYYSQITHVTAFKITAAIIDLLVRNF